MARTVRSSGCHRGGASRAAAAGRQGCPSARKAVSAAPPLTRPPAQSAAVPRPPNMSHLALGGLAWQGGPLAPLVGGSTVRSPHTAPAAPLPLPARPLVQRGPAWRLGQAGRRAARRGGSGGARGGGVGGVAAAASSRPSSSQPSSSGAPAAPDDAHASSHQVPAAAGEQRGEQQEDSGPPPRPPLPDGALSLANSATGLAATLSRLAATPLGPPPAAPDPVPAAAETAAASSGGSSSSGGGASSSAVPAAPAAPSPPATAAPPGSASLPKGDELEGLFQRLTAAAAAAPDPEIEPVRQLLAVVPPSGDGRRAYIRSLVRAAPRVAARPPCCAVHSASACLLGTG